MEKKKSNKGLVIFLIFLIVLLGTGLGLLLSGVIKNPFVKEKVCKKCTCTKCDVKTKDTKEVKETRYYQYIGKGTPKYGNEPIDNYYEIELNADGTAKIDFLDVLDVNPKTGIYVENDKYIILTLNNDSDECYEGNYNAMLADVCADTMILIKDNGVLKFQRGTIYHFEIDNVNNAQEFIKVQKSELHTNLKN